VGAWVSCTFPLSGITKHGQAGVWVSPAHGRGRRVPSGAAPFLLTIRFPHTHPLKRARRPADRAGKVGAMSSRRDPSAPRYLFPHKHITHARAPGTTKRPRTGAHPLPTVRGPRVTHGYQVSHSVWSPPRPALPGVRERRAIPTTPRTRTHLNARASRSLATKRAAPGGTALGTGGYRGIGGMGFPRQLSYMLLRRAASPIA
jgi:hypothetical protein